MLDLPLGVDTSGHVQVDGRGDLRGERTPLLSTRVEMVVGTRGGITLLEAVGGREGGWVGGGGGDWVRRLPRRCQRQRGERYRKTVCVQGAGSVSTVSIASTLQVDGSGDLRGKRTPLLGPLLRGAQGTHPTGRGRI